MLYQATKANEKEFFNTLMETPSSAGSTLSDFEKGNPIMSIKAHAKPICWTSLKKRHGWRPSGPQYYKECVSQCTQCKEATWIQDTDNEVEKQIKEALRFGKATVAEDPVPVRPNRWVRTPSRIPFGRAWLKPNFRMGRHEIRCPHPSHGRCFKSLTWNISGSKDVAVRMLKLWAICGVDKTSKAAHQDTWASILAMDSNELPSDEWLEAHAPRQ